MIEQSFLSDIADYIDNRIHSVRLNDSVIFTKWTVKEAQDCCVSLEFMVPYGTVDSITKIEILDAESAVISTNNVNVPITSDTVILQAFEVEEG